MCTFWSAAAATAAAATLQTIESVGFHFDRWPFRFCIRNWHGVNKSTHTNEYASISATAASNTIHRAQPQNVSIQIRTLFVVGEMGCKDEDDKMKRLILTRQFACAKHTFVMTMCHHFIHHYR